MPPRPQSQTVDLNLSFLKHPATNDVVVLRDADAVKRSIKHLVLTQPYEQPFIPAMGTRVYAMLFEPLDLITERLIVREIERVIRQFEPRCELVSIDMETPDDNSYDVTITFRLLNRSTEESVNLTLVRNR
jgi:phage baseplate assembly protein W